MEKTCAGCVIAFIVESNECRIMCVSRIVFMRDHFILYSAIQFEKVAIANDPEIWIVIYCLVDNASALGSLYSIDMLKFIITNQRR